MKMCVQVSIKCSIKKFHLTVLHVLNVSFIIINVCKTLDNELNSENKIIDIIIKTMPIHIILLYKKQIYNFIKNK